MPTSSCKSPSPPTQRMPRGQRGLRSPLDTRSRSPQLRDFLLHLASERGLADNTLLAYRRDLEALEDFLIDRGHTFTTAKADDYIAYLHGQRRARMATKTVARRIAAIRVFLRFLAGHGHDVDKILQQIERPKPERSLPKVLGRQQVTALIAAPSPKSSLFARDVAILELLY